MPEPAADFMRLIRRRVPALSPTDLRASLTRVRLAVDYPVVQLSASSPGEAAHTCRGDRIAQGTAIHGGPGQSTPWRGITLGELIASGAIRPPLEIETAYKGHRLTGRIEADGMVTWSGTQFESLSHAGGMARKSIVGAPEGRPYPPTNGWTFWRYRGADGSLRFIDELRRDFHERKVVDLQARRPPA